MSYQEITNLHDQASRMYVKDITEARAAGRHALADECIAMLDQQIAMPEGTRKATDNSWWMLHSMTHDQLRQVQRFIQSFV